MRTQFHSTKADLLTATQNNSRHLAMVLGGYRTLTALAQQQGLGPAGLQGPDALAAAAAAGAMPLQAVYGAAAGHLVPGRWPLGYGPHASQLSQPQQVAHMYAAGALEGAGGAYTVHPGHVYQQGQLVPGWAHEAAAVVAGGGGISGMPLSMPMPLQGQGLGVAAAEGAAPAGASGGAQALQGSAYAGVPFGPGAGAGARRSRGGRGGGAAAAAAAAAAAGAGALEGTQQFQPALTGGACRFACLLLGYWQCSNGQLQWPPPRVAV